MNFIRTPLVFNANSTTIKYPTDKALWRNAYTEDDFVYGYFEGSLYKADGMSKSFAWELASAPQQYKQRGLTLTEFRRLYGDSQILADKVRDGINGNLDYLVGASIAGRPPIHVDMPADELNLPGITYRDLLRSTFVSFYSAPVIDCDDPETIRGILTHYYVGILPSEVEVNRILKGVPL